MNNTRKRVDLILSSIIFKSPVLAYITRLLNKKEGDFIPTAGVKCDENGFNLYYNKKFISDLTTGQLEAVMKHELFHIVLGHVFSEAKGMFVNIAMDLSINQFLENLPDGCCSIDDFNPKLPPKLSWGEYYSILREKKKEIEKLIKEGKIKIEDIKKSHEEFGKGDIMIYKSIVEDAIKNADRNKLWGNCPGDLQEHIKAAFNREIPWKNIVKMFTESALSSNKINSRRHYNKKFGNILPGKKKEKVCKIIVFLDVSGSMPSEDLAYAAGSISNLIKETGVELEFCTWDTEIHDVFRNVDSYKKDFTITGRGGTDVSCVFEYVRKKTNGCDGMVILTDGEFCERDLDYHSLPKILWIFTKDGWNENVRGNKTKFKNTFSEKYGD